MLCCWFSPRGCVPLPNFDEPNADWCAGFTAQKASTSTKPRHIFEIHGGEGGGCPTNQSVTLLLLLLRMWVAQQQQPELIGDTLGVEEGELW